MRPVYSGERPWTGRLRSPSIIAIAIVRARAPRIGSNQPPAAAELVRSSSESARVAPVSAATRGTERSWPLEPAEAAGDDGGSLPAGRADARWSLGVGGRRGRGRLAVGGARLANFSFCLLRGSHQFVRSSTTCPLDPSENRVTRRSQERQGPDRAHPTPRPFVCRLRSWASSSEAAKAHIPYPPQSLDKTALAPLALASAQTRRRLATEPWRRIYNTKRWEDTRRRALDRPGHVCGPCGSDRHRTFTTSSPCERAV